jgi:HTH-type transcriptional regulator / antitoxin HipB
MSYMKDIALRGAEQLGRVIRLKRREKNLSQAALAELLGVERKWVLRLEAGNAKAELGLVLRALKALDIRASLSDSDRPSPGNNPPGASTSRLDEVFLRLKRAGRR